MTPAAITDHFCRLGMPSADAESRATLLQQVGRGIESAVGAEPSWRWFVPGRIEVFGKHTDYAGGRSLLAAAPRGIAVVARARPDQIVRLIDVRYGNVAMINVADPHEQHRGFANYVRVVARRLALNFPGAALGADIAIASDLPRAAGVSSSSALVVGVASALIKRGELTVRDEWRAAISSSETLAWYLGCVENGLDFPGLPGTIGVGTHGGSEDHTAILACKTGHVSQFRFVPVTPLGEVAMPPEWTFVIASSGVQADKAGSVLERYNRASNATRALLAIWNARASEPSRSLGHVLASGKGEAQMRSWLGPSPDGQFSTEELYKRLVHFMREDHRVELAARAFGNGDRDALGALSAASQRDADELLGNQIPETRALAAAARDVGAFAASSFGAGFGGSVWALVEQRDAERFSTEWVSTYRRGTSAPGPIEWFISRPAPPLTEIENLE